MQVDFMIIGAQKCGTTTLSKILQHHPGVVCCDEKEPHFFSETDDWRSHIDEYHAMFPQKSGVKYFEASTTYTFYPYRNLHIWDDIYTYNPEMKFIYLVRNPYDRIVSSYMHAYEKGHTDNTFEEALIFDRFHTEITRYYTQIYPYIKKFGAEQVLLIEFDEFIHHRQRVMRQVSNFLELDFTLFPAFEEVHANKSVGGRKIHHKYDSPPIYLKAVRKFLPSLWNKITDNADRAFYEKPRLEESHKELISNFLRLDIIELQKLMNRDLSHWLKGIEPLAQPVRLSNN
ncbi:MAG: sulfotransferase [Balneolaceae bacterium]|nr:sulfotransferase [Balneolaceae bacterium]